MTLTRRESLLAALAAILAPSGVRKVPEPCEGFDSWDEVAELLARMEAGAVDWLDGRPISSPSPRFGRLNWCPGIVVLYGSGPPDRSAADLADTLARVGHVALGHHLADLRRTSWTVVVEVDLEAQHGPA